MTALTTRAGGQQVSIFDRTLKEILTALASDTPSPGSGAAAAITLAFAAACAGKAAAISLKHRRAENSTEKKSLAAAEQRLKAIVRASLERADADAKLFESFIHHKDRQNAEALVRADESAQALARELDSVLNEIHAAVHPVVAADIAAARVLLSAASHIESRIRAENQRSVQAPN